MKKLLLSAFAITFLTVCSAQTTVASGNWSNPATWGGMPPTGSGTVVINHTVTLDFDYSHTSGSITVNASGAINGNSASRGFALNFPSGTATLTNSGTINVARTALFSGTATNNGSMQADSLYNQSALTNGSTSTITAAQFMNATGGSITNNGTTSSVNFFNTETVNNNGSMSSNDFTNAKTFNNNSTGILSITNNFANDDTISSPAIFTNDGSVTVNNDWYNGNQVTGSGRFCVGNNSMNAGTMTGTFDFCDQSGTNVDFSTGTIAGTITYCQFTCATGISETADLSAQLFPNPFTSIATVKTSFEMKNAVAVIFDVTGKEIFRLQNLNGFQFILDGGNMNKGMYFISILSNGSTVKTKFIAE